MNVWVKRGLMAVAAIFAAAQFFGPARTNPPTDSALHMYSQLKMTAEEQRVFRGACADCHSNDTVWPWYSRVAPVSWWTIDHVNHARSHMNVSEWGRFPPRTQAALLDEMCEQVREGAMPLPSYQPMHPAAQFTPEQRRAFCEWTAAMQPRVPTAASPAAAPPTP
jgi:hypothetical protein